MSLIRWTPSFSVHVEFADTEHKGLIAHINDLGQALDSAAPRKVQLALLNNLRAAVEEHFAHEEEVMRQVGYRDYVGHRNEHRKYATAIRRYIRQIESGKAELSVQMLEYLRSWLTRHIQGTDMQYADKFNAGGFH